MYEDFVKKEMKFNENIKFLNNIETCYIGKFTSLKWNDNVNTAESFVVAYLLFVKLVFGIKSTLFR